jgi:hypothetical protein
VVSHFEASPQEKGFLGSCIGNMRLLFVESKVEMLLQEGCNFLFDFLRQGAIPTESDNPVVGISQVFDPNEVRIIDVGGR